MDQTCMQCTRLALRSSRGALYQNATRRSFGTTIIALQDDKPHSSGVAQAGSSMKEAMNKDSIPKRPPFRKLDLGANSGSEGANDTPTSPPRTPRPLIRRQDTTRAQPGRADNQSAASGPVLRRSPQSGQVLTRNRPSGSAMGNRAGSPLVRRSSAPQKGGKPGAGPDKRRRRAPKQEDEGEVDQAALNKQMDEYITKHIDRPENPTEPVPFNPTETKLGDLRSDWPNTPLSTIGMTESVIQKIEWIARRLPHGYQSPEQIAEHYLKGNLTRFESVEEKGLVVGLASEKSRRTRQEIDQGDAGETRDLRFKALKYPTFVQLQSPQNKYYFKKTDVAGTYNDFVKESRRQDYDFMKVVVKRLENNQSYGPTEMRKVLKRIQALIPQGRPSAPATKA